MSRRRAGEKQREKWMKKEKNYQKHIDSLEAEVEKLRETIRVNFHPKSFNISTCPARTVCPVMYCEDNMKTTCKMGTERDCTLCDHFNDQKECDNWVWRNCTLARLQAGLEPTSYDKQSMRVKDFAEAKKKILEERA